MSQAPIAPGAGADAAAARFGLGWSSTSPGSWAHGGLEEWAGAPEGTVPAGGVANLGFSHSRGSHLCVCAQPEMSTNPCSCPCSPTLPSTALGKAPVTRTSPFQGEKCPFWGLWSLSGLHGKFFLVKDSPPLPCSGRCLYGAFQVPEELWEDFLFPFCYMAEAQNEPWPAPGRSDFSFKGMKS